MYSREMYLAADIGTLKKMTSEILTKGDTNLIQRFSGFSPEQIQDAATYWMMNYKGENGFSSWIVEKYATLCWRFTTLAEEIKPCPCKLDDIINANHFESYNLDSNDEGIHNISREENYQKTKKEWTSPVNNCIYTVIFKSYHAQREYIFVAMHPELEDDRHNNILVSLEDLKARWVDITNIACLSLKQEFYKEDFLFKG